MLVIIHVIQTTALRRYPKLFQDYLWCPLDPSPFMLFRAPAGCERPPRHEQSLDDTFMVVADAVNRSRWLPNETDLLLLHDTFQ